jgi:hypothetical protein
MLGHRLVLRRAAVSIALACLLFFCESEPSLAVASLADKFEVTGEKDLLETPVGGNGFAALSSDGRSLLIIKAGRLTVRPLDSPVEKELLPPGSICPAGLGAAYWATWSKDGRAIYYLQLGEQFGIDDLWRLDIASLTKKLLIKNTGNLSAPKPQPSPDGKSIAFYRGNTLMLSDAEGRSERSPCEGCPPAIRAVIWSPDSSRLVLVSGTTGAEDAQLHLLEVATGKARPIAPWKGPVSIGSLVWPSWSSGPFFTAIEWHQEKGHSEFVSAHIWHLSVPKQGSEERTQVTQDSVNAT